MTEAIFETYATFAATVAAILVATEFLKNLLKTSGFQSQLLSWAVGIVTVMFGWWASFGWLADVELWWHAAIWAVGAALAANGAFDVPVIKVIIQSIFGFMTKK